MSTKQNLMNGSGETFTLNIEFKDSDDNPVDLTGHTVDFILNKAGSGTLIGSYPASVDDEGNISIKVTDEVTAIWPVGKSRFIVNHTYPNGDEKWLVDGYLTVMSRG